MRKLYVMLLAYVTTSGPKFETDRFFIYLLSKFAEICARLYAFVQKTNTTHNTENRKVEVMHQNREQNRQQWFWFYSFMNRVIAYSTHDFCLLYTGKFAVASLSRLPEASLLNSIKRGYAGPGCRSCIYPNKMQPPFINNFIGHIYDFGQPIFMLCPIMRPHYVQIWSVATLSAGLEDKLYWLFQLFLPSPSTFSRSPVWLLATPHAAVTSAGCASKRSAGTNVKAIGNFRAARRARGAAVPGQRAHPPFYPNIRTQQDHQQKSSFLC